MPLPYGGYSDLFVADTNRLPSPTIWQTAPVDAVKLGAKNGMYYWNDFESSLSADNATVTLVDQVGWDATAATSGVALTTAATSTNRGGIWNLDAIAATNTQGIQVQQGKVASWILTATNGEALYYEARVRPAVTIVGDYAIGMFETDTSITDGTTITTVNHIGFTSLTGNGVLLAAAMKASVGTTTTGTTFVLATFVKLGFVVYYTSAGLVCDFLVNGLKVGSSITSTNIPLVALRPSFVCQATGTGIPGLDIDWIQVLHVFGLNT